MLRHFSIILCLLIGQNLFAQEEQQTILKEKAITRPVINPLAPSKAAFFSAILPGLGQAYNKKYWKIPIVYGAMGSSLYVYSSRNNQYQDFRDAYKLRLAGQLDDYSYYTDTQLLNAMKSVKKDRDLMMMLTVGLYALNIVDAVVDAHLKGFNVDEKLTFAPIIIQNDLYKTTGFALAITYNFK